MKVIFAGTPEFAVPVLEAILASSHKVELVITQTDKVNVRGNKIRYSPLKEAAIRLGLPIAQYEKISNNTAELAAMRPDIIITAGYGQILSRQLLKVPKYGIINVHGSLLPKYRGASPVQSALLNGEKVIGVTIMNTRFALDAGEIILQQELTLQGNENAGQCLEKLAYIGGELAVKALDLIEQGKAVYKEQDESLATYCKLIKKEQGQLNFSNSAQAEVNKVRAFTPNPSAFVRSKLGRIKVVSSKVMPNNSNVGAGTILAASAKEGLIVKCAKDAIALRRVQPEGGKVMDIADFMRGRGAAFAVGENIVNG